MLLGSTAISICLDFKEEIWSCLEIEYLPCLQVRERFLLPVPWNPAVPSTATAARLCPWVCPNARTRTRTRTAPTAEHTNSYKYTSAISAPTGVPKSPLPHCQPPFAAFLTLPSLSAQQGGDDLPGHCTQQCPLTVPTASSHSQPQGAGESHISTLWCSACSSQYNQRLWEIAIRTSISDWRAQEPSRSQDLPAVHK